MKTCLKHNHAVIVYELQGICPLCDAEKQIAAWELSLIDNDNLAAERVVNEYCDLPVEVQRSEGPFTYWLCNRLQKNVLKLKQKEG